MARQSVGSEEYIATLVQIHIPPERRVALEEEERAREANIAAEAREKLLQSVKCSLCNQAVPRDLAEEGLEIGKRPFRQQVSFCNKHTKYDTSQEWISRGYPSMNWEVLEERIASLYPDIQATVCGKRWSAFEDLMNEKCYIRGDGASTAKRMRLTALNDDMLRRVSVGYYGPRGAGIM